MLTKLIPILLIVCATPSFGLPVRSVAPDEDFLQIARSIEQRAYLLLESTDDLDVDAAHPTLSNARQRYREIIRFTGTAGSGELNLRARRLLINSYLKSGSTQDKRLALSEICNSIPFLYNDGRIWLLAADAAADLVLKRYDENRTEEADILLKHLWARLPREHVRIVQKHSGDMILDRDLLDHELDSLFIGLVENLYEISRLHPVNSDYALERSAAFMLNIYEHEPDKRYLLNAIEWASRALSLSPYDYRILTLLAKAHHLTAAIAADDAAEEHINAAAEAYRSAMLLNPMHPDATGSYVRAMHEAGKAAEAVDFLKAIGPSFTCREARIRTETELANLYSVIGNLDAAEERYAMLLQAHPLNAELHLSLFEHHRRHEQDEQALLTLQRLVNNIPDLLNARIALADYHIRRNEIEKAKEHYHAVLRSRAAGSMIVLQTAGSEPPELTIELLNEAVMGLAAIYIDRGEHLKAGDIISFNSPVYFYAHPSGALHYDAQGHPIPREPRELAADAMHLAGLSYARARHRSQAIDRLKLAIWIRGGHFHEVQRQLAGVYYSMNNLNITSGERTNAIFNALRIWRDIFENHPNDPQVVFAIAQLGYEHAIRTHTRSEIASATEESIRLLGKLAEMEPDAADVLLMRAIINDYTGRHEDALEDVQAVLSLQEESAMMVDERAFRPVQAGELEALQSVAIIAKANLLIDGPDPDFDKAEQLLQPLVSEKMPKREALASFAWLHFRRAQLEEDEELRKNYLDEASRLNKLTERRRTTHSSRLIYRAAEIMLASEQTYASRNQVRRYLQGALAEEPGFPEAARANELLKELSER